MNNKGKVTLYVIGAILAVCVIALCLDAMDKIDTMTISAQNAIVKEPSTIR